MNTLKIATWNVNSLRVRLPHVLQWLSHAQPDVLALQETKLQDVDFPHADFQAVGYDVVYSGQKTYNGMAILSRKPGVDIITDIPGLHDPQRRVLGITIGDIRILNLYVPNGASLISDKYSYKLHWLAQLTAYLASEIIIHPKMIILGDFNIAPFDIDIHNPENVVGQILCSEPERAAYQQILQVGFTDCFRHIHPEAVSYSWWDYRMNAFKRNLGWRIDLILSSQALLANCLTCSIDKEPRGWERPSDHTPVIAEFST
jgi:exodeoxyribonuclease-3